MTNISDPVKNVLDAIAALTAAAGVFLSTIVPALAAVASLAWYGIRIYEWYKSKKESGNGNERINKLDPK